MKFSFSATVAILAISTTNVEAVKLDASLANDYPDWAMEYANQAWAHMGGELGGSLPGDQFGKAAYMADW